MDDGWIVDGWWMDGGWMVDKWWMVGGGCMKGGGVKSWMNGVWMKR